MKSPFDFWHAYGAWGFSVDFYVGFFGVAAFRWNIDLMLELGR